jgi:hypothetical protein
MSKLINSATHTGFAIAISWPETYCKQAGNWYDNLLNSIGLAKHHYYKVGHAALVLVNAQNGECRYFDFGRYHTPWKMGRARSEKTDPGLKIKTRAQFSASKKEILNFEEILSELQQNAECHGEGAIHASYGAINFEKALAKAHQFQEMSPLAYGPFKFRGSNCSRFVNDCIVAGKPRLWSLLKLRVFIPFTPTTLSNVNALCHKTVIPKLLVSPPFYPAPLKDKLFLKTTLAQPERVSAIPPDAQWLSGEGCGSWFHISALENNYLISRYNKEGEVEFSEIFQLPPEAFFDLRKAFRFDYLSHHQKVSIVQDDLRIELTNHTI